VLRYRAACDGRGGNWKGWERGEGRDRRERRGWEGKGGTAGEGSVVESKKSLK